MPNVLEIDGSAPIQSERVREELKCIIDGREVTLDMLIDLSVRIDSLLAESYYQNSRLVSIENAFVEAEQPCCCIECDVKAPRLVGIELNPGPKVVTLRNKKKAVAKAEKKVIKEVVKAETRHPTKVKNWVGDVASSVGKSVAGPLGGYLFQKAGDWFGKITGMGAYHVKSNTVLSQGPALFGDRSFTTSHRECLGDVLGTVAFNITQYSVNPGLTATFPWASQMACCYQQYILLGCVFEFRTTSGDAIASTNNALGTVIMASNYNVLAPAFSTKIAMEASEFATSAKPSESFVHPIECDPGVTQLKTKLLRVGALSGTGYALQDYDHCNFYIATQGMQTSTTIGELWVTYHVKYLKPVLTSTLLANSGHATGQAVTSQPVNILTAVSGSLGVQKASNTDFTVTGLTLGAHYFVVYSGSTTGTITGFTSMGLVSGGTGLSVFTSSSGVTDNSSNVINAGSGSVPSTVTACLAFTATGTFARLTVGNGVVGAYYTDVFAFTMDSSTLTLFEPSIQDRLLKLERQLKDTDCKEFEVIIH